MKLKNEDIFLRLLNKRSQEENELIECGSVNYLVWTLEAQGHACGLNWGFPQSAHPAYINLPLCRAEIHRQLTSDLKLNLNLHYV